MKSNRLRRVVVLLVLLSSNAVVVYGVVEDVLGHVVRGRVLGCARDRGVLVIGVGVHAHVSAETDVFVVAEVVGFFC